MSTVPVPDRSSSFDRSWRYFHSGLVRDDVDPLLSAAHGASSFGRTLAVGYKGYKEYGVVGLVGLEIAYGLGAVIASVAGAVIGGKNGAAVGAILIDAYGIYKGYETYKGGK